MASQLLFCAFCILVLSPLSYVESLDQEEALTLDAVRVFLTREEDTIVFSLIERAKYPYNAPAYDPSYLRSSSASYHVNRSLVELFIRETEAIQAKAGRFRNPEEVPFFPELGLPFTPPYPFPQDLYPAAASVNVSETIWKMYFDQLLPFFTAKGTDGNYAVTSALDLACLQALSRRIHYGRYVAEAKYKEAPEDYKAAILAKDRNALMELVTFKSQEEVVMNRVEKKAEVFGQEVTLDTTNTTTAAGIDKNDTTGPTYKVDPLIVYQLYRDWVIPLTKEVEVQYLLRRLY